VKVELKLVGLDTKATVRNAITGIAAIAPVSDVDVSKRVAAPHPNRFISVIGRILDRA
jgi:hypothetical protein